MMEGALGEPKNIWDYSQTPRKVIPNDYVMTKEQATPLKITPPGIKFDGDKLKWSLLDFSALAEIVKVLAYGEKKYTQVVDGKEISGADNWKLVPDKRTRYFNAAMRHLLAWKGGEKRDPETGLLHLAHLGCCVMFLIWSDLNES